MTMHYVVGQNAGQYKSPMEVHPCSSIGVTIYNYEYDDYNYVFLFVCPLYIIRCVFHGIRLKVVVSVLCVFMVSL